MAKKNIKATTKRNPRAGKRSSKNVGTIPPLGKKFRTDLILEKDRPQSLIDVMGKGGREAAFATPQHLLDAFVDYIKWSDSNPLLQHDIKAEDKMLTDIYLKHVRPWSLHAFCLYVGVTTTWWREFKKSKAYQSNAQFSSAVETIEMAVYQQKFDGAAVGMFNAIIISRDIGLREQVDNTINDQRKDVAGLFPFKAPDEK